jgi:DNA-binding CsgD family transcriptional regulator
MSQLADDTAVRLRAEQVRDLIRLVAVLNEVPDRRERARRFVDGLKRLLGAYTAILLLAGGDAEVVEGDADAARPVAEALARPAGARPESPVTRHDGGDLYAWLATEKGGVHALGFRRAQPFDECDRNLLALALAEAPRLLARTPADEVRARLSPRAAATLDALLEGASEKEAADRLGISPYTVHDYVKMIYRVAGVQSRGELLALCLRR